MKYYVGDTVRYTSETLKYYFSTRPQYHGNLTIISVDSERIKYKTEQGLVGQDRLHHFELVEKDIRLF